MLLSQKENKYKRIYSQIESLVSDCDSPISRMATIVAILHHKINYFYWTGYYLLNSNKLQIGPYQGTLACLNLKQNTGVCWSGINSKKAIIVPDVHAFEGHIACDPKSSSEIVVPLYNKNDIVGILDVDSYTKNTFDELDLIYLQKINELVHTSGK